MLSRGDQEKVEVHLRLMPGGEDKGTQGNHHYAGHHTPMMVTTIDWPVCLFPRNQNRGGRGHGAGCRHIRQECVVG